MIRILLADDHELVRHAISEFLSISRDIAVVAEASCGAEMLEKLSQVEVDLLSLDMQMPGLSGAELIRCVRASHPSLPILVVSAYQEAAVVSQAMRAGASGYIGKDCLPATLLDAIRKTVSTGRYLPPELAQHLAFMNTSPNVGDIRAILSDREVQVFERVVAGKPIKQIANELCISDKTVSTHKAHVLEKLGLRSVPDLVKYAIQQRLFE